MSTSSRIIKNTGYLYVKMGISMIVSLYSTRLILASLGAVDFGIFNVVGGAIAFFGFLSGTLANATQRFMSYAEGEGLLENKIRIFNVSIVLHVVIAAITVSMLLIAMVPLFNGIFNIPAERITATKIVYVCLLVNLVLTIINAPYEAVMNAHENMLYYSIVGIIESFLRLGIAFICVYTAKDKLVVYSLLVTLVPLVTLSVMKVYCHRRYEECIIAPQRYWDGDLVRKIAGFSGWNFLTAISSIFSASGIGVVLNHYFGSALNAAQGVAQQVNGSVSNFSTNMMKALNPVIVKNAGAKNMDAMNRVTIAGCKYSGLLTMFFGIPLSLEIQYVLSIWLKEVPDWTAIFVILQLVLGIITQMAMSAATAVYAQGDIKHYAIWKSIMNALPVIITWIAFNFGCSPIWLYLPMIVVWGIGGDIVIVLFAQKQCGMSAKVYSKEVLFPLTATVIIMLLGGCVPLLLMREGFFRLIITCIATSMGMVLSCILFVIKDDEKEQIKQCVGRFICRNK